MIIKRIFLNTAYTSHHPVTIYLIWLTKVMCVIFLSSFSLSSLADSTDVGPVTVTPFQTPIMMDSGYYNFDSTSKTWVGVFNTHRLCPSQYSPYLTFIPNITWNPDPAAAFLITFRTITKNQANYTVSFNKQYGQDSGGIAFTWVLYCYPPNMNPPAYLPYGGNF